MATDLMSQAEYARHRGCSSVAVLKAIRAGRITTIEKDGKTWIDPEVADIQWAKNTRPRPIDLTTTEVPTTALPQAATTAPADAQLYDMQTARAKREHHEANLADLRERKAAGTLLERTRIEKAAADVAAAVKGALEQLPSKLAMQLAAESDSTAVRNLLARSVAEVLENLADELDRMAGAEASDAQIS